MTRVAAGFSSLTETAEAADDAARAASDELAGAGADLAFLFLSPEHLDAASEGAAAVRDALAPRTLLGCVAQGVVAGDRELEEGPAAAVWAASLPGAAVEAFHLEPDDTRGDGVPELASADVVLLLVDPFSFRVDRLLAWANETNPGVPFVGGIAVGAGRSGAQALFLDGEVHDAGAVGAALAGVAVEAVVSQGCAPLGRESVITRADANVVFELAGQPALARLKETLAALSPREQALASRGLLAGIVIDENLPEYRRGDFLMRSILGADESTGAIAVGEEVRVGQTLRFHARDAASADEDLRAALQDALLEPVRRPAGALLFTCNGRGTNMFDAPDHDSRAVASALGRPGLAGFFCGGEIGPVGGCNFLHGFTATMAVFLELESG